MEKNRKSESKGEKLFEQVTRILEKEGAKGWKLAQETLLKQKTKNKQLQEAINYTMLEGKPDFFRPAFVALCCKAVEGDPEVTIPCGASLVLFSRAIGIHDDVIDNLKKRNKRLTLFGKFGKDFALILSDILLFKGFTLMRKSIEIGIPQQSVVQILDVIDRIWFEQGEGEFFEIGAKRQTTVSTQECMAKIRMRASELEAIARIGGILGGGSQKEIVALGGFGRHLGIMSILREEIIDMLEFNVLRHRIRYESLPLPLIHAMQDSKARSQIASLIFKKKLTNTDLRAISNISDRVGSIGYVSSQIHAMRTKAISNLESLQTESAELKLMVASLLLNSKYRKPNARST